MAKISFQTSELILSNVQPDNKFVCKNGQNFLNLEGLLGGLKKMSNSVFNYHVNERKNDFSNWIYDVVGDVNLADDLRKIKNMDEMVKKIKSRINYLKRYKND